ncbi:MULTISPECIES: NAD(P)-dependent alcohol dehydrogenase [unclassified Amycolatopsis]|uniref:NAD(P)-dependent alcohol dehydrogenase n=1 Tax=unclassified Amycolatopsis TaxID=2618356 RepID=UPI00287509C7|nr:MULTISPECIES: NAD(P)-dependent alcohol dehydrogenase [unclassified Amycolatopsis]MDS0137916.1 NAD(P)-dependent alcohol dehydrogenase [Amycolatopsis sp. 505]MDS0144171.1 NAD(P)-dependent alcohol dehydrogenase [Amycolatopsis sp. CM201R]
MKAIVQDRYGNLGVLEPRDIERPAPGPGEVLVRVHAAGVDPGVWHLTTGQPYLVRLLGFGVRRPKNPVRGLDFAGTIEETGDGVTKFRPGAEVFGECTGAFAEYAVAKADRVAAKPARLSFEQAGAVAISGCTALQGLRDAGRVRPGQSVLVIGAAGGVGSFAVQLAKTFGAEVTAVCSTGKTDLVRELGADHVVDYTREDFTGRRYDLVLDTAGARRLRHLRRALTPRGTLVLVGSETGGRWLGGTQRVAGAALLSLFVGHRLRGLVSAVRGADLEVLRETIGAGGLTPVLDRTYPLADAAAAIDYVHKGHSAGKVVLTL